MSIDLKSLSKLQREQLRKELDAIELEEKEAYKKEFVEAVVEIAVEKGVRWSEALTLLGGYTPENDQKAKKMGFKFKGQDKSGKVTYYVRKVAGASKIG